MITTNEQIFIDGLFQVLEGNYYNKTEEQANVLNYIKDNLHKII